MSSSSVINASFEAYNSETQRHIIELGIFIYEKSLEHIKSNQEKDRNNPDGVSSDHWSKEYEFSQLKRQYENLSERVFEIREEEYKKGEMKLTEYKQTLELERRRFDKIVETFQRDTERQITAKTAHLSEQIAELKAKNQWYYSLYEDKSKGKNYEEELYPKLLDYNDKYLNSLWNITHVGSVLSEKTDFHFRNKDTNMVILLDTKNNLPTNPVVSTSEFERDVMRKETNAIGGIMLANGGISCKKRFEINKIQDKMLVYISEFERNNIGYIFSLLDMIVEISRNAASDTSSSTLRALLLADYKREQGTLESLERMRKVAQKSVDSIVADFATYFGEDIEMESKTTEVQTSSVRIKPKTSTDIIDFDVIEHAKTVIGQRSKYYLEYGNTIQYFKNNYARNLKIKSLGNQETNLIISVKTE